MVTVVRIEAAAVIVYLPHHPHELAESYVLALGELHAALRGPVPEPHTQHTALQLVLQLKGREHYTMVVLGKFLEGGQVHSGFPINLPQLSLSTKYSSNMKNTKTKYIIYYIIK